MSQERVLIVDDDREIAELVRDYLEEDGFQVSLAFDGEQALQSYRTIQPQLLVLDIMLPKIDGMEVCRMIRTESSIPILILSARNGEIDKILGLGLGADDYVTKPFSPRELAARVKAHLRRYKQMPFPAAVDEIIQYEGLEINLSSHTVTVAGKIVPFSAKEFEVLKLLSSNPFHVLTRDQIFDQVWGYNEYGDINTVTVHIKKIREKIEKDPSSPQFIKTVWGVGYKFEGGR